LLNPETSVVGMVASSRSKVGVRLAAWGASIGLLVLFAVRQVVPSAEMPNTVGFATLYTESRILREAPHDLYKVYDDAWFQPQVDRLLGAHLREIAHGQPPTMSLILSPLASFPAKSARLAWVGISVLLWTAGLWVLSIVLGLPRMYGVPPLIWLTAVGTAYRPITENLRRGQGYALIFLLLCGAIAILLRAERRRWPIVGTLLALMLLLKSAGLWLLLVLVATRRWRVLAGAAVTAAAVILACSPFIGWMIWPIYGRDAAAWMSNPSNYVTAYQTIRGLTGHLLISDPYWNPRPVADLPTLAHVLAIGLVAGAFGVTTWIQRLDSEVHAERALTVGMVVSLIATAPPVAENYHYVLVFPAVVIAWWWAMRARASWPTLLLLAACTSLLCVPQRFYGSVRIRDGWSALLAYPLVYGAVGLWAFFVHALASPPEARRAV
jgi:hypothetical protein